MAKNTKKVTISEETSVQLRDLQQHFEGRLTKQHIIEEIVAFFHKNMRDGKVHVKK